MRYHCILVLSVILLASLAKPLSPSWDNMHIKHSWNAVPTNWVSLGRPPSGTTIDLYIALKPNRENALIDALWLTSSHHCPETLELVDSWLEHHGISSSSVSMTHGGNTLKLQGVSVTQANTLLGASYEVYRHVERGETILITVTPSFLRWLYDTEAYTPHAMDKNVLGVLGFKGDTPSPADLAAFMRKYRDADSDVVTEYLKVVEVGGGVYDPTHPNIEANLVIQCAEAMAYPTSHTFYSIGRGPSGRGDWYVTWLEYILDQRDIPQTISISYGYEERWTSREYAFYVCNMFAMLGSLGVSVLVSSGNDGIGRGTCVNQGRQGPYVTVVGGTTDYQPEVAAVFSGGGFSDHFERPPYQRQAVPTFLEDLGNRYQGLYNDSGRGIPDLAAQSVNFQILFNGREQRERGTSLATPVVAGIISLLNDWLISTDRQPLGFLNPWLYGMGRAALNDITEGSNPGCGVDGFSAIAGWDPVTGLGTPNFRRMMGQLV
ncbi:peptidase S8/S53 domain-containing protein [Lactarius hatsudake]|nr:peptidase S8/S53 domain-containing protein [Lactarius hatsudake]